MIKFWILEPDGYASVDGEWNEPVDLAEAYLAATVEHVAKLRSSQLPVIRAAADLLAATWRGGGCLFVARTQHTLHGELANRASGPVAAAVLDDGGATHDEIVERLPGVRAGDLVLIHANCGTTRKIVSIAETARGLGAATIALTQIEYERSELVERPHPSGRALHEVADLTVDLGGVVGDGVLSVPGSEVTVGPTSGVSGVAAAWAIVSRACEVLAAEGSVPPLLRSVQLPGAEEYNRAVLEQCQAARAAGTTPRGMELPPPGPTYIRK